MVKVVGIEGMSDQQIADEIRRGGKFVIYLYCISVLILTFKRPSDIHFVRAGNSTVARGAGFTILSLLLGWWGIPWGPIYTIQACGTNLRGGKDVTHEIMGNIR